MKSLNRKELSRLDRSFPHIQERQSLDYPFREGDESYVRKNLGAATWFLDNSKLLLEVLERYRIITEITFEGEKPNE